MTKRPKLQSLRSILGFTPPEWAYLSSQRRGVAITQGFVRTLDRKVRMQPLRALRVDGATKDRLVALVETACDLMEEGCPSVKNQSIQHLGELSTAGAPAGKQKFQVIACIAGRGFGVRREDMKKMLLATRGKVFTLKTLSRLVECSDLRKFRTKS